MNPIRSRWRAHKIAKHQRRVGQFELERRVRAYRQLFDSFPNWLIYVAFSQEEEDQVRERYRQARAAGATVTNVALVKVEDLVKVETLGLVGLREREIA